MLSGVGLGCPLGDTQAGPGDSRRAHQAASLEQPVPVPDSTSHPQLPPVKQGLSVLFVSWAGEAPRLRGEESWVQPKATAQPGQGWLPFSLEKTEVLSSSNLSPAVYYK